MAAGTGVHRAEPLALLAMLIPPTLPPKSCPVPGSLSGLLPGICRLILLSPPMTLILGPGYRPLCHCLPGECQAAPRGQGQELHPTCRAHSCGNVWAEAGGCQCLNQQRFKTPNPDNLVQWAKSHLEEGPGTELPVPRASRGRGASPRRSWTCFTNAAQGPGPRHGSCWKHSGQRQPKHAPAPGYLGAPNGAGL